MSQSPSCPVKSSIWVLGAGQLGAMLKHAGMPLALDVRPIDIHEQAAPQLSPTDLVTAEREQWPSTLVTDALAKHPLFINKNVFGRLADRKTQKELIDSLGLATAPWRSVDHSITANELRNQLGEKVLLKRRTGGYDGKGQHWLRYAEDQIPSDWHDHAIAEQAIAFDEEVSLVGVRNRAGDCVFYPVTLNLHLNGILYASIAPLERLKHYQPQAEMMLRKLLNELDYVGVMAMECFRVGDQLMINELAPRVHNSGHWTQSGASISQFEYHLRALADLPIPPPQILGQSAMINLIGIEQKIDWLALSSAQLYWYGKAVLPGRKVGHINFTAENSTALAKNIWPLQTSLPDAFYATTLTWVTQQLA